MDARRRCVACACPALAPPEAVRLTHLQTKSGIGVVAVARIAFGFSPARSDDKTPPAEATGDPCTRIPRSGCTAAMPDRGYAGGQRPLDRKSTRLNSSHLGIS